MKKKKFSKKLALNKETISNLDNIKGGKVLGFTVVNPTDVLCTTDICASIARCTWGCDTFEAC
ncbi:MAG: class I lanthipeptide [Bacteroidales bacterium]|nr:class I lanthipeptide [Bacteroidales bacterium]